MQYVIKNEIEPKVSLVILLGKMDDDNYTGFHSELNHLLELDHSIVFDCNALNEVNTPGIQALSALSSKAKSFSNIVAFFGLSNRVTQALTDANVLDSFIIAENNFEAMKMAKKLQPQKEELRKIKFGREQKIPKSQQKQITPNTKNKDKLDVTHQESPFYQHIKSQAEEAIRWEKILDDKLIDEHHSNTDNHSQTETNLTPEDNQAKVIHTPDKQKDNTTPVPGVTQYEKEMLFDDIKTQAKPIEHGVTLAEKEDLFAEIETKTTHSTNREHQINKQGLLMPILFGLCLIVGVLNIFREPIQQALLSPKILDQIAKDKALANLSAEDKIVLPSIITNKNTNTILPPSVTPPPIIEDIKMNDEELLSLVSQIKLPTRIKAEPITQPILTDKMQTPQNEPQQIPEAQPTPTPTPTQPNSVLPPASIPTTKIHKQTEETAINEPASIDVVEPLIEPEPEIEPGLFQ